MRKIESFVFQDYHRRRKKSLQSRFSAAALPFHLLCILCSGLVTIPAPAGAGDRETTRDMSAIGPRTERIEAAAYQRILYVSSADGSDQAGEGTRQKPWKTLTQALSRIQDAAESKRAAVLCSEGTCAKDTIQMKPYVDLFGGFDPRTWDRDIFRHASILDGQGARRVVVGADHARIDGFTIKRGLARSHGGGILCDDTSPLITNNFITDNFVLEPENFNRARIHQNGNHGGGIACLYNAIPVIRNNVISGNRTSIGNGGGIAFYGWFRQAAVPPPAVKDNRLTGGPTPILENNVITGNIAGVNDSARTRSSNGGGVSCAYEARPTIRNNVIAANQARGNGDGGGIYSEFFSYPWIEGNWIIGNVCDDDGGGFYTMREGQPFLVRNLIAGNWSTNGGVGGIRLSKEGRARIVNNLIVDNQSGGGVTTDDSYLELEGNTLMNNRGGAAMTYDMNFTYFMPSIVRNNILRNNEGGSIKLRAQAGLPMTVEENNVEGGYQGKGNFDRNPGLLSDGLRNPFVSAQFDSVRHVTILRIENSWAKGDAPTGRVIRIGNRWSAVKEIIGNQILVWGDLTSGLDGPREFEIIPSYMVDNR